MYAKVTNDVVSQYPYTIGQFRRDNPNVSFPKIIPEEMLLEWGVVRVIPTSEPHYDQRIQKAVQETVPTKQKDGYWALSWTISEKTEKEIQEYNAAKTSEVREIRNKKLAASDWTQVPDAPVDQAAWRTYRQALRDITVQSGFPHEVTWPVAP